MSARARVMRVLGLALLPVLAIAAIAVWQDVDRREDRIAQNQADLARAAALTTESIVAAHVRALQTIAAGLDGFDVGELDALSERLSRFRTGNPEWEGLSVIGKDGWNIVASDAAPRSVYLGDREYFQEVMASGAPTVSSAVIGRISSLPTVVLAVPVTTGSGERAVLIGPIPTERLAADLQQRLGARNSLLLVDRRGQIFAHPDPERTLRLEPAGDRPEVSLALQGEGTTAVTRVDGKEMLVSAAPIGSTGWAVVMEAPTTGAFADLNQSILMNVGVLTLVLGTTLSIGWHYAGRLATSYASLDGARREALTSRSEAEVASQRYLDLVEGLDAIVWESDARTLRPTFVSHHAERVLGYPASHWLREPDFWIDHLHEDDRDEVLAFSLDRVAQGEDHALEYRMVRADGEAVWIADAVRIVPDEQGEPALLRGLMMDITERRRADEERTGLLLAERDARQRAELAMRARDEFLSIASHELRNPVAAIKGSAQLLRRLRERGDLSDGQFEHYASSVVHMSDRLARLLEDLLDVGRLESGQFRLRMELLDVSSLVERVVEEERDNHPDTSIRLDGFEEGVTVQADAERIQQVMQDLVDNAVKYSPAGLEILVCLRQEDDRVGISVQDQGIGIPPGAEETIFEPFGRASNAGTIAGMGLGLYICRRLAEAHGGDLVASSDGQGHGSTFTLWLPQDAKVPSAQPIWSQATSEQGVWV